MAPPTADVLFAPVEWATFALKVQRISVGFAEALLSPPPPQSSKQAYPVVMLPVNSQSVSVGLPFSMRIPPPDASALFATNRQFAIVGLPVEVNMPPPPTR